MCRGTFLGFLEGHLLKLVFERSDISWEIVLKCVAKGCSLQISGENWNRTADSPLDPFSSHHGDLPSKFYLVCSNYTFCGVENRDFCFLTACAGARLVANRKHLEMSKSDRTWAICVDGLGGADGSLSCGLQMVDMDTWKCFGNDFNMVWEWWICKTWHGSGSSEVILLILAKPISSCKCCFDILPWRDGLFSSLQGVYDRIGAKHGKARGRKICKQEGSEWVRCKF